MSTYFGLFWLLFATLGGIFNLTSTKPKQKTEYFSNFISVLGTMILERCKIFYSILKTKSTFGNSDSLSVPLKYVQLGPLPPGEESLEPLIIEVNSGLASHQHPVQVLIHIHLQHCGKHLRGGGVQDQVRQPIMRGASTEGQS